MKLIILIGESSKYLQSDAHERSVGPARDSVHGSKNRVRESSFW
jgi:hypothetical protein